jgi:hypothetical protein
MTAKQELRRFIESLPEKDAGLWLLAMRITILMPWRCSPRPLMMSP